MGYLFTAPPAKCSHCSLPWTKGYLIIAALPDLHRRIAPVFQILKDDAAEVLYSLCQQFSKTQQWSQERKRSVFIPIAKKVNAKECSNYRTGALISHSSKIMLKILQARLQQYMNSELPDVQVVLEKAEEPEIKLPTSAGSWKKQESSRKTSISPLLTVPKPLMVWITINCGKF